MRYRIGQKVRLLHDSGEGVIISLIDKYHVEVDLGDDFPIDVHISGDKNESLRVGPTCLGHCTFALQPDHPCCLAIPSHRSPFKVLTYGYSDSGIFVDIIVGHGMDGFTPS